MTRYLNLARLAMGKVKENNINGPLSGGAKNVAHYGRMELPGGDKSRIPRKSKSRESLAASCRIMLISLQTSSTPGGNRTTDLRIRNRFLEMT